MNDTQRLQSALAFQAYNAMETTKQRHLGLLQAIETRTKKFNLPATDQEQTLLSQLLKDHNAQVEQFKLESDALKAAHPETHTAMFLYLGQIHQVLDAFHTAAAKDASAH